MNLLAHFYLSGPDEGIRFGNFIGDFVKGRQFEQFPAAVATGIRLHRQIDQYTDTHAVVTASKRRLQPRYRHYAGVIVDIYYDHFLSANWLQYHHVPLADFSQQCYATISQQQHLLPERAARMFPYMQKGNWLYHYQFVEGIGQALAGMSRRSTFESGIEHATEELQAHYDQFASEFHAFFPQLQAFAKQWLQENGPA